jgi:hypothetical protein
MQADSTRLQLAPEQFNGLAAPGTGTPSNPADSVLTAVGDRALYTDGRGNPWTTGHFSPIPTTGDRAARVPNGRRGRRSQRFLVPRLRPSGPKPNRPHPQTHNGKASPNPFCPAGFSHLCLIWVYELPFRRHGSAPT